MRNLHQLLDLADQAATALAAQALDRYRWADCILAAALDHLTLTDPAAWLDRAAFELDRLDPDLGDLDQELLDALQVHAVDQAVHALLELRGAHHADQVATLAGQGAADLAADLEHLVDAQLERAARVLEPAYPARLEADLSQVRGQGSTLVVACQALHQHATTRPASADVDQAAVDRMRAAAMRADASQAALDVVAERAADLAARYMVAARWERWEVLPGRAQVALELDRDHVGPLVRRTLHLASVVGPGRRRPGLDQVNGQAALEVAATCTLQAIRGRRRGDGRATVEALAEAAHQAALELLELARVEALADVVALACTPRPHQAATSVLGALHQAEAIAQDLADRDLVRDLEPALLESSAASVALVRDVRALVLGRLDLEAQHLAHVMVPTADQVARLVHLVKLERPTWLEPLDHDVLERGVDATLVAWSALELALARTADRLATR